jgi:hypothetical protein
VSTFFVCNEGTVFENSMFETNKLENKKVENFQLFLPGKRFVVWNGEWGKSQLVLVRLSLWLSINATLTFCHFINKLFLNSVFFQTATVPRI